MNNILLIDKDAGWTSNDVVSVLKKKLNPNPKKKLELNEKRFRIGHAGTLDPFATGLLVILLGDSTKKFAEFQQLKKEYVAEIEFGVETDTYDITGKIVNKDNFFLESLKEGPGLKKEAIDKILRDNFTGKILQTPPKYSALKINGKKMYKIVYSGEEIADELLGSKKREVEIYEWEVLSLEKNILKFKYLGTKN
jgi:tRNA pseudouridine55 synthase